MGFSRQENWSGLPFPSGDLLDPGIKPGSPEIQADDLPPAPEESPSVFRCYILRDYTLFMSGGPSTAVCQIVCEYMRACPRKTMHHIPKFITSWPEPLGSSWSFRSLALEPRTQHKTRRRPWPRPALLRWPLITLALPWTACGRAAPQLDSIPGRQSFLCRGKVSLAFGECS